MWLGTIRHGLLARPVRRSSIAPAAMVAVLPAPTTWASSAVGSLTIRRIAAFWCSFIVQPLIRPGRVSAEPEYSGSTRLLNCSL
ncbi:hypothetical protein SFUMM280S_03482 [Streptomyces fumanus]